MFKKEKGQFPYNLEKMFTDWTHSIAIKKLGLPHEKRHFRRKFIAIQIDALAYETLERNLHKPCCRFLRSLLIDKRYFVSKYNCSLPSDTPTALAGILYGASEEAIGFKYADKKKKVINTFYSPEVAFQMEEHISKKYKGILKDGSSQLLTYTGEADRTFLTLSKFLKKKQLKRIKESDMIILAILNPFVLIKVIYNSCTELLLELYDALRSFLHRTFIVREKKAGFKLSYPFRRFFYQGIIIELQRIGAVLDMKRGLPRLYMNFNSYDDILHRWGVESAASLSILRQIDRTIKNIYKHKPDDYDFYVLSDHGSEDSLPFDAVYDEPLGDFLKRITKVDVQESTNEDESIPRPFFVRMRLKSALRFVTGPIRWGLKIILKVLSKEYRQSERDAVWKDKEQIFVMKFGSMAPIYFNVSNKRLEYKEINKRYPNLLMELKKHPGIGFVVMKDGLTTRIISWDSEYIISNKPKGGKAKILSHKGKEFLKKYGKTENILEQIRSLNNRKNIGDMLLFGDYHHGKIITFADFYATHGGLGKRMSYPFLLSKQAFDMRDVKSNDDIYKIFREYL